MRRVRNQPKEFSKKILIVAGVMNAVVIIFTMIMIWRTLDLTPPCLSHTVSSRRGSNWDRLLLLKSQSREQNQTYAAVQGRSAGTTFFR